MNHPPDKHTAHEPLPRLIAWEVTRSCMLACRHCRAAADNAAYEGELSTEECYRLLDNIASFSKPIIILTGGEPMLRPDIYDIARYAGNLGLPTVMAPCGMLLDDTAAARILDAGIQRISISIDGATAESHDSFRGVPGAFDAAIKAVEAARRAGLPFQINTTITQHNISELEEILQLSIRLGAGVFNPFLLVPTGRGRQLADEEISPQAYEDTLRWLAVKQEQRDIPIRVTCAPHFQRVRREMGYPVSPHQSKGCMGGQSFAFISHRGTVQICGFLDVECGDVRRESYDFARIWKTSKVFQQMRDVDSYGGRCGRCEYRGVCGGCRARAHSATGDYLAEEPFCVHQPKQKDTPLDTDDKRILSIIQTDFPIDEQPCDVLAKRLDIQPEDVLQKVVKLSETGVIRRVGPVFDSRMLGYASTLAAAHVPAERLAETVELINAIPGVTHNYRRDHYYNVWFTLAARSESEIESTLARLRHQTGTEEIHSLPAEDVYKIRVEFPMDGKFSPAEPAPSRREERKAAPIDETGRKLIRLLQAGITLEARPFDSAARELGVTPGEVVRQAAQWSRTGVIRRFGAVVRHHKVGAKANGMCVFRVPEETVQKAGSTLAQHHRVTHCYRRRTFPKWDYNLFAMVHGVTEPEVLGFAKRISHEIAAEAHEVLFSREEFKKEPMRYFVEDAGQI